MFLFFFLSQGGGNLVQTIKRSYSLSDLSEPDVHRSQDEASIKFECNRVDTVKQMLHFEIVINVFDCSQILKEVK